MVTVTREKIEAVVLSDGAERMLGRLLDATLAGTFGGVFTPTEAARVFGIDNVPRAAILVGELYRAGHVTSTEKLLPAEGDRGYRRALAWTVSRAALLREIRGLRKLALRAEGQTIGENAPHSGPK